jgi:hypothetical protein
MESCEASDMDRLSILHLTPTEDSADKARRLEDKVLIVFHQTCGQRD